MPLLGLLSWDPICNWSHCKPIQESSASTYHRRVPDLQMSCRMLTIWQGTRIIDTCISCRWHAPHGVRTSPKYPNVQSNMMTSSNKNIFRVTCPLWRESTGDRWIPLAKASDAGLWCFLWSAPEQTIDQQSRRRWFETPSRSLWRHRKILQRNGNVSTIHYYITNCLHLRGTIQNYYIQVLRFGATYTRGFTVMRLPAACVIPCNEFASR